MTTDPMTHDDQRPRGPDNRSGRSADALGGQLVRDHARLAEGLGDAIWQLRHAQLVHENIDEARDRLEALLVETLIPDLEAEDSAPHAIGPNRRRRHQMHEHRKMIVAAHEMQRAATTAHALARAEKVRTLLCAHLVGEDRDLIASAQAGPEQRSGRIAVSAELDELLVHDHARIHEAIIEARAATAKGSRGRLDAYDRAAAAVSHHAAVMSVRAYPMIRAADPGLDRASTRALTQDFRRAERAMGHLNRLLRGAAGEDASDRHRIELWDGIEADWQHHAAGEELLVCRAAPLLGSEQVVALITALRRPAGRTLTRPHPRLLGGGWPTRTAIRAQGHLDRWRDEFDNRATWS